MVSLEGMADIAELLDEWCELCGEKLASIESADGVKACAYCAEQVVKALQAYERDAADTAGPSTNHRHTRSEDSLMSPSKTSMGDWRMTSTTSFASSNNSAHLGVVGGPNREQRRRAARHAKLRNDGTRKS